MKIPRLLFTLLACAAPVGAQENFVVSPARAAQLAAPSLLSLHLRDVTLGAALEELQRQSKVKLFVSGEDKATLATKISVDIETRSFNEAFGAIIEAAKIQAHLRRSVPGRTARAHLNEADKDAGAPLAMNGLFGVRLYWLQIREAKELKWDGNGQVERREDRRHLNVHYALLPDLRIALAGEPELRFTRAEDEQGRSLLPPVERAYQLRAYNSYTWNHWSLGGRSGLMAPAADAKKLAHLEGVVTYALVSRRDLWEVPDVLAAPQWKRTFRGNGHTFDATFKVTTGQNAKAEFELEILFSPFERGEFAPPMRLSEYIFQSTKIEGTGGVKFLTDWQKTRWDADERTMRVPFYQILEDGEVADALKPPLKFSFDAPVEWAQTEVPFSFENVPLP